MLKTHKLHKPEKIKLTGYELVWLLHAHTPTTRVHTPRLSERKHDKRTRHAANIKQTKTAAHFRARNGS